ncbi:hypothetical protein LTR67_010957 [Exophiala xenobiotica]
MAGQQEDPAQPSEKNHDLEPISITVPSEYDPNRTYTTKCPFNLSILTETDPVDKDLYDDCADRIIEDEDTLTRQAKESMLRWLEAHEREGVKGVRTLPPANTVAALEPTPASTVAAPEHTPASTVAATEPTPVMNNPPAPTPFEPINLAELLAYKEPTLLENKSDILFCAHQLGSAVMWVRDLNP